MLLLINEERNISMQQNIEKKISINQLTFSHCLLNYEKRIYTTNIIDNLNRNIHKITKTKSGFTSKNR